MLLSLADEHGFVALRDVEQELAYQMQGGQTAGDEPVLRARMSNLVIFCDRAELAEQLAPEIPRIVRIHPARVFLLVGERGGDGNDLKASVRTWCHRLGGRKVCSDEITLRARGAGVDRLPFAVRGLVIGDLPVNVWWAAAQPPPLAGPLLHELSESAQQVVYDSIGWPDPLRGVAAVAPWMRQAEANRWRVVSDLNWRRLKAWRRLLAQALDPASAPGAIESVREVLLEHGPHAVVQAWQLLGWLASRLEWRLQRGQTRIGQEFLLDLAAPHGTLRVRIHRLEQGPPSIRRIRIACTLDGRPTALNLTAEDDRRLSVLPEGAGAAARTLTLPRESLAELVGRQLCDRERDPVFGEAMAAAQVLAEGLLA
jgi:glucose-6-phosphate dehydrogenase assembly protein OpcA